MTNMDLQQVKQRFGIIGNTEGLNRAIERAIQVAPTDLAVLVTGESGTGKETFPKIIHQYSSRKHGEYIAVNCGAIPEGTIDSELFGHEKGAFTGAHEARKGYFEVADNGTIFLDEVAEMPLSTQARLLRVLESGEFIRVGSSKVQKTNVRVVAATNVNVLQAVEMGKFREDLYYRLNTVPIKVPPLRERVDDIHLLFRKFTADFADKFKMPPLTLTPDARAMLERFRWPGNVRQLKNITEQLSILEENRTITAETLARYLPENEGAHLPALVGHADEQSFSSEREILYKVLFDMKNDMNDLKRLVHDLMEQRGDDVQLSKDHARIIQSIYTDHKQGYGDADGSPMIISHHSEPQSTHIQDTEEFVEESLSLEDKEVEMIRKALQRHNGKRKYAAEDLGISERTLYRKIKEHNLE
ncbi:MAG: sigma-54-dependent Fis family transcriptional regulator [Salinivirgaceae bacterium]|nr:sigma-54-dependent Fis family transcriptional regulator [Salinivirgaceae bacterium]